MEPEGGTPDVRKAITIARERGWRAAIDTVCDARARRYITDEARTRYLDLIPVGSNSRVLEIGADWGQHTIAMARRFSFVDALEVCPDHAEFAALRCRQEGLGNVAVACGGADCRLPYRDESFHAVVVNLVFEWCGARCRDEPHETAQRRLLGEVYRTLVPGGIIYLATKNRFAARLLVGGRDEHAFGLRWGSCLPRPLFQWLLRRSGHHRSGGHLYSYSALRGLLRSSGFAVMQSYWPIPDFRYPRGFVPTAAEAVRDTQRSGATPLAETRVTRWAMRSLPASLVKHFASGLTFVAAKPTGAEPIRQFADSFRLGAAKRQ